jgi:hypothetical protein
MLPTKTPRAERRLYWAGTYQITRGQLAQFAIAGVAALGAFSVLYYCAYSVGRRWPLRPARSLDYQAHPHLQKKFPN